MSRNSIACSKLLHFVQELTGIIPFGIKIAGLDFKVGCHAISNENFPSFRVRNATDCRRNAMFTTFICALCSTTFADKLRLYSQ